MIVFNVHRINFEEITLLDFKIAVNRLLLVVQEYMFYPGRIENWVVIAELDNNGRDRS